MAFGDWTFVGQQEYFNQSEKKSFQGDRSLLVRQQRSSGQQNAVVLSESIDDAPTEAQIVTHVTAGGRGNSFGAAFRWQDPDNFYSIDSIGFTGEEDEDIGLYREIDGEGTTVDTMYMQNWPTDYSGWFQFRCTAFLFDDELHIRPEFRDSTENEWMRYNEDRDLIEVSPQLTAGGGVGFVFYSPSNVDAYTDDIYIDNTKLFY